MNTQRFFVIAMMACGCLLNLPTAMALQDDADKQATDDQKHQHSNRLVDETSPYLLLHAHNPVDWYPWGEEALQKAKDENKVIFLSIGYSSCHWCHVMERESFLDEEIAKYMNEHFVCIKVDREERPDVDSIYMMSLNVYNQLARTGRGGGWPLSMFLTPDAEPFFGGTYFPPRDGDRGARVGFLTILQMVHKNWDEQPDRIRRDSKLLADLTRTELDGKQDGDGEDVRLAWIAKGLASLEQEFDSEHGGFGFDPNNPRVPKFPEPSNLLFLVDVLRDDPKNESAQKMLETSLQKMSMGGIYDHVGGGFHRYSVDRFWHIPHFEKMLYDNGLLLTVYSEAYKLTGREDFRMIAEGIAEFVRREMVADGGGFYSALDAESEGEEGRFYRWESDELQSVLDSAELLELYSTVYGTNGDPNFEEKYYVPQLSTPLMDIAKQRELSLADLVKQLEPAQEKLLASRDQRERPLTDIKVLTSWNGLMIRGLADAGRLLENDEYLAMAATAADFLWENSFVDGRLRRTFTDGQARLNGYLDDYAFLIDGLIALHQADGEAKWLDRALLLQKKQDELFWDEEHSGYFFTSNDHESLLARAKRPADAAIPSGNSVSIANLLYLSEQANDASFREKALRSAEAVSGLVKRIPHASPRLLISVRALVDEEE